MLAPDFFQRLPSPTASLILAALLTLTNAHALPRQTKTVQHRTLNVELWPPAPTEAPLPLARAQIDALLLRRQDFNTVCGFLEGNADIPVTCGAGSHCVVDRDHNAIGCCPDGEPACTTGVFTGCVDFNSGPQTEVNPYVYTCAGSDVCYRNVFAGGFSQYGCGTASNLAASVATAVSGLSSDLRFSQVTDQFTAEVTTVSEPITINPSTGTRSLTASSSSTTESTTTSSSTTTSTSSETASSTAAAGEAGEAPEGNGSKNQTGAIIGGTISGVAVLVALVALGFYLWKRKQRNTREGPPTLDTKYISPMSNGAGFTPVAPSQEYAETGFYPMHAAAAAPKPAHVPAVYGVGSSTERPDQVPLTREFDDFHRGFSEALENIREEDETAMTGSPGGQAGAAGQGAGRGQGQGYSSVSTETETPLWQQNRRQSRNMMWM
ncbi:hypothetical protein SAPIO_CDS7535 [Scedosporium apiospermum]|uniref:Mid2 domain-containing protein n=1 Tax=Pseudallescheria apiosperma TaxID=563466 RepID=A0A084G245_PSEDA|nr:uncharacterized protein SAPIO_CDS7535 [Scedosporium apiospermum]KEZ41407.1 hypothetical protein SAPIO_CDS7535 [Scedosporium apiospermum]